MNIYQNFYDLLNTYIFGGSIVSGSYQELVAVLVSTCAVLFCVAIPFIIVWKAIRLISGG